MIAPLGPRVLSPLGQGRKPPARSALFTAANSEYLINATPTAAVQAGDVDLWLAAWVNLASKGGNRRILSKFDSPNRAYLLTFSAGVDRFRFNVSTTGSNAVSVDADNLGSPSLNTWYFLLAWHDSVGNTINIRANAGTATSAAHTAGIFSGTSSLVIGAAATPGEFWDGRIDEVAMGKSPTGGIASAISSIHSALYNGGSGLRVSDLTATQLTDFGVGGAWPLDAYSDGTGAVTRPDLLGANDLTDTNTVASGNPAPL